MTRQKIFDLIIAYFKDKPVKKISVFGSYATGKYNSGSDIDLIISLEKPVGLIKLSGYRLDLEKKLGIPIDLGTEKGISPFILPYITKEIKVIYEQPRKR
ncbi:MAG TPA: nucleotidyltransferase domain-containing protein [Bacteroidia bacterium]|nr:nucleotidyltransferase domain-containing protein [Bacteroidia bacterium]